MMGIIKWEYLAHRLPNIATMQLVFIGPELEQEEDEEVPVPQCGDCTSLGRNITYQTHSSTYQQMRKVDDTLPDLVLVQNCGFAECDDKNGCTEWEEDWAGLGHLLHESSLVIFTSYTKGEADADLRRFLDHCDAEVEVLVKAKENPMRSHRPIRDWELDRDRDVFYSNQSPVFNNIESGSVLEHEPAASSAGPAAAAWRRTAASSQVTSIAS